MHWSLITSEVYLLPTWKLDLSFKSRNQIKIQLWCLFHARQSSSPSNGLQALYNYNLLFQAPALSCLLSTPISYHSFYHFLPLLLTLPHHTGLPTVPHVAGMLPSIIRHEQFLLPQMFFAHCHGPFLYLLQVCAQFAPSWLLCNVILFSWSPIFLDSYII